MLKKYWFIGFSFFFSSSKTNIIVVYYDRRPTENIFVTYFDLHRESWGSRMNEIYHVLLHFYKQPWALMVMLEEDQPLSNQVLLSAL